MPTYVPGAIRVDLRYVLTTGQHVENVLHLAGFEETTSLEAVAIDVFDTWGTNIMGNLCSNTVLTEVQLTDIGAAGGATASYGTSLAGGSSASPLPPQNCMVLSWKTGRAGRSYRGRTYLPGIGEDKVDGGGTIVGTFSNGLRLAAQQVLEDLATAGYPLIVLSRTLSLGTAVTSVAVDSRIDTQRRRLS